MKKFVIWVSLFLSIFLLKAPASGHAADDQPIVPAAERLSAYLPLLKGKKLGIFANHTSMVKDDHLVDMLKNKGVSISKIFAPEHGFRGTADAGEKVDNSIDAATGIPVISLYGKKTKPSAEDLADVDLMLFDIQDVGVRFYTYISSLEHFIVAALANNKELIILDRPNPNGFYIDGPVLDRKFRSFVGMQPVPVVYGMTVGEYAQMIIGEKWIDSSVHKKLTGNLQDMGIHIIPCEGYTHQSRYELPVKPSPNLPDIQSIYLYPSTCFFEGTTLSEGRGTPKPFQIFGHPALPKNLFAFTPRPVDGAKNPKLKDQKSYGWDLSGSVEEVEGKVAKRVQIRWLLEAYRLFPQKDSFFLKNNFFNLLAGNDLLKNQIIKGVSEAEIRKSWEPDLANFRKIRKNYLLYKDFE